MEKTVLVRGRWVVAHDGRDHRIVENGVVVYRGDTVIHVGTSWDGEADDVVEGRRRLVIPGLISCHTHLRGNEGYRMVVDGGRRDFLRNGFVNYAGRRADTGVTFLDPGNPIAGMRLALANHILSGVTTLIEIGGGAPDEGESALALAEECGIRLYYSPSFNGAHYVVESDGRLTQHWDEKSGFAGLERACAFIERHGDAASGRFRPLLVIDEFFGSTPELRRKTREAATALGVRITLHFCEQIFEFHRTLRHTGRTPVQILADEGFLGPDVVLGHALYLGGHSATGYPYGGEIETIARSGASIAHSPVAFARRGMALESFERYRAAGINIALGTDTHPTDLISEMRMAALAGKMAERNNEVASAADVFRAATTGGAAALGRDDLGRLSPGAKADIVVVDLDNITVGPVLDPIRALVYSATGDMVDRVIVDGRTLVADKRLLGWDSAEVLDEAERSSNAIWRGFPAYHWAGRTVEDVFPPSFAPWK
jgi:cytosine/adenosine deaminase-related metal-dependent hydrolase